MKRSVTNICFSALIGLFLAVIFYGCANNPGFSDTPEIVFAGFSADTLVQGDLNTDSLFIVLEFRDGDGDIGGGTENIIIMDNRTGDVYDFFKIPEIGDNGSQNGIEGTITIKLFTTCCIFPESIPPCFAPPDYPTNEISFDIVMIDNAGNESNIETTPSVTLLCN